MNRIVLLSIYAAITAATCAWCDQSGVPWIAGGGPNGIYVNLGNAIPGFGEVGAYVVERRVIGGASWDTVARRVEAPKDAAAFGERLKQAERSIAAIIPRQTMTPDSLWRKVKGIASINLLKQTGSALAVRLALGVMLLDSTAIRGAGYEYRVCQLMRDGRIGEAMTSKSVLWPSTALQVRMKTIGRENDEHVIRVTWLFDSPKRPAIMKAIRGEEHGDLSLWEKAPLVIKSTKGNSIRLTLIDTAVTPGSLYRYSIATWDYFGNPGPSADTVLAAAFPFQQVALPHHITAQSSDSLHGLRIRWQLDDPKNVHTVRLHRSTAHDSGFSVIADLPASVTEYVDQDVTPMQKYFYCLTITDAFGDESPLSARVFGLFQDHTPPLALGLRKGPSVKGGVGMVVTRTDRTATAFRMYRCDGLGASFMPISPLIPLTDSETTFLDTSRALKPFLAYGYSAQAENVAHTGGQMSDTVYAQAAVPVELHAPLTLSAKIDDGNRISLYWTDAHSVNPGMTGYLVFRKTAGADFTPVDTVPLGVNHNWFTDTATIAGTNYEYIVKCIDAAGNRSPQSPVASIEIPVRKPLAPAGVHAIATAGGISVFWDEPIDSTVTAYKIHRYERGSDPQPVATVEKGKSNFVDQAAEGSGLRFYYVTSQNAKGIESEPSGEVSVRR